MGIRDFFKRVFMPVEYDLDKRRELCQELKVTIKENMRPITEEDVLAAKSYAKRPTNYYAGDIQVKKFKYSLFALFLIAKSLKHLGRDQAGRLVRSFERELLVSDKQEIFTHLLDISHLEEESE